MLQQTIFDLRTNMEAPRMCLFTRARRNHNYASVADDDLEFFRSVVGPDAVKTFADELDVFNTDWMGQYRGSSPVALVPKTTEEISRILRHCNKRRIAVVPQGGNTGLVGGSVPTGGEVVLSTSRMNRVVSFDPVAGVIVCEVSPRVHAAPSIHSARESLVNVRQQAGVSGRGRER